MSDGTSVEGKWISFVEIDPAPKTKRWQVVEKSTMESLGRVSWAGRWRRYAFVAFEGAMLEESCLRDIADFCMDRTSLHRTSLRDRPMQRVR